MKYIIKRNKNNIVSFYQVWKEGFVAPEGNDIVESEKEIRPPSKAGEELIWDDENGFQTKIDEKKATEIERHIQYRNWFNEYKKIWKDSRNNGNYARYIDEIKKVVFDYQMTGVFKIEHAGLKAFVKSKGINITE